jgi:hypothetical protein
VNEIDLVMQLIRQGEHAPPFPWMAVLRSHCVALAEIDPELVSAISVTTQLMSDDSREADAVNRLCELMADEFGFAVTVEVAGRRVSARFARAGVSGDDTQQSAGWREDLHG